MKSRSFDLKQASAVSTKHDKTIDFIGFYKTTAETNKIPVKETPGTKTELITDKIKKKKPEPVSISQIDIDGSSLNCSFGGSTPLNNFKVTSTPNCSTKNLIQTGKVKSIMKNTSQQDDDMDRTGSVKKLSKKRNKTVSFMLDDNDDDDVAVKKIKSDDTKNIEKPKFFKTKTYIKFTKVHHSEKENKSDINQNVEKVQKSKPKLNKKIIVENVPPIDSNSDLEHFPMKEDKMKTHKNLRKFKKRESYASNEGSAPVIELNNKQYIQIKVKTIKKKKYQINKRLDDEEPVTKYRKKDIKPEVIAEDLENLSIGDNTHTLTNLLEEMTVGGKNKLTKTKRKENRATPVPPQQTIPIEDEKEKVKWKKRKWNKDKKGDIEVESLNTSVIVENLPISIMLTYKKVLAEYLEKCGLIKKIGSAEVYPTEDSKPIFTTTINFHNEEAASKALEENNSILEGSRIRIKRPLPPTETTVVVRTYAELDEQNVTSLFTGTGKIRNIRHVVKGKKTMSTAFVEFDGPETVERAIRKAKDLKISGKKVHIAKFEMRVLKKKSKTDEDFDNQKNDNNSLNK